MKQEIELCFSDEGMTYANSMKYRLDDTLIQINQNTNVVKENFIKVKQTVSIGVVSAEKHMGATSVAFNLTLFLKSLNNTTACYIEYNDHNTLETLKTKSNSIYYQDIGKIDYQGIDMFLKPQSVADIQKFDYEFYVYDFGAFNELSQEQKDIFLSRDLKLLVSGFKPWEENNLINTLIEVGDDNNLYILLNLVDENIKNTVKDNLGDYKNRAYFLELMYDPFVLKNQAVFNTLLRPYLHESQIIEEKHKKGLFGKKKKKN